MLHFFQHFNLTTQVSLLLEMQQQVFLHQMETQKKIKLQMEFEPTTLRDQIPSGAWIFFSEFPFDAKNLLLYFNFKNNN